jgi:hypothetical protein
MASGRREVPGYQGSDRHLIDGGSQLLLGNLCYRGRVETIDPLIRPLGGMYRGRDRDLVPLTIIRGLDINKDIIVNVPVLLVSETLGAIHIYRGALVALTKPKGLTEKRGREMHGLGAVLLYGAQPAGALAHLQPDIPSISDPLLMVIKREYALLPRSVVALFPFAVEAHDFDTRCLIGLEESVLLGAAA